jgi:hypothetical protein
VLLVGQRAWRRWRGKASKHPVPVFASRVLTFGCVLAGYALFAMDLPTAMLFYKHLWIG